jgi:hypothetical protein
LQDFDFYQNETMEKYFKMTASGCQQSIWVIKLIEGLKDKISRGLGRLG